MKKGFTLIELVVVIAIIGVLVGLGSGLYKGYTKEAEFAKHMTYVRELETASERYYMNESKWPRIGDKALSEIEVAKYAERIYDITGKTVELNEGNYYEIDYTELSKYTKVPVDKGNYILQNPVGRVYYLEDLTEKGKNREVGNGGLEDDFEVSAKLSYDEINRLINTGYIPVATPEDVDYIRSNTARIYGEGTAWERTASGGLNKKYIQVSDVDMSEVETFVPIGNTGNSFTGVYNGGNNKIIGLTINSRNSRIGLFGVTYGSTLENIGMIDVDITGNEYVGSLVGTVENSTKILNSYSRGIVKGNYRVGGLVGGSNYITITESRSTCVVEGDNQVGGLIGNASNSAKLAKIHATGDVTGKTQVGGLIGYSYDNPEVHESYAAGDVQGISYIGGLAGSHASRSSGYGKINGSYSTGDITGTGDYVGGLMGSNTTSNIVINSYSTGCVTGITNVGGLVGSNKSSLGISRSYATGSVNGVDNVGGLIGNNTGKIMDSYAAGSVMGRSYVGGLIGNGGSDTYNITNTYATGNVTGNGNVGGHTGSRGYTEYTKNSYYDKLTTGKTVSKGGMPKITEQMYKQSTYEGWDFTSIWKIVEGTTYPTLK